MRYYLSVSFSLLFLSLAISCQVNEAAARQTEVSGGISVSFDFDDREYKNEVVEDEDGNEEEPREDEQYRRIVIRPDITLVNSSAKNRFQFSYAPSFKYDMDESDNYLGHYLDASGLAYVTEKLFFRVSEVFIASDDPRDTDEETEDDDTGEETSGDTTEESGDVTEDDRLSDDASRHRYWTNTFQISSGYRYGDDRLISLGYIYTVLRNDDTSVDGYEDYDKHEFYSSVGHKANNKWKVLVSGRYVDGNFHTPDREIEDEELETFEDDFIPGVTGQVSDDVREHYATLSLESNHFRQDPLFMEYRYIGSDYNDPLYDDIKIHEGTLSWQHFFSKEHQVLIGGGPSYRETENRDPLWGYNGVFDYTYKQERSSITLSVNKGFGQDNFSGLDERGFTDYWLFKGNLSYQFTEKLSGSLFTSLKYEDRLDFEVTFDDDGELVDDSDPEYHTDRYVGGISLAYTFLRWYTLSLRYTYTELDSDNVRDDYIDHRVMAGITYSADWKKW